MSAPLHTWDSECNLTRLLADLSESAIDVAVARVAQVRR